MEAMANGISGPWVDNRTLLVGGLISLVLHALGLVLLIWMPNFHWGADDLGPVYTVDLVGDPGLPPPPPPQGDPDAGPQEVVPEDAVIPESAAAEPVQPAELIPVGKDEEKIEEEKKPEEIESVVKMGTPKKSSKEAKVQPEKDIDEALDKLKKKVTKETPKKSPGVEGENTEEKHLDKALARVRQRVDSGVYGVGGGGGGGGADSRMARYYTAVWQKIRSNWTLPSEWSDKKMEAVVIISLLPNGAITSIRFEKRSGFPTFDQSVLWAVERSNPLPAMPAGMSSGAMEIGVRFRPEG